MPPSARRILPTGGTLPLPAFEARHRAVVALLWVHVIALPLFGVARGYTLPHGMLDVVPVAICAVAAGRRVFSRRGRATVAALGLVTCSAVLTHLWGGVIEAHFHFFVAVALLALYEDWIPWLLAISYVLVHHGLMGVLDPKSVYGGHAAAEAHPWKWAAVHAGFIAALALVNLASWRSNELARREAVRNEERFHSAFDDAPHGMAIVDPKGIAVDVNDALVELTGLERAALIGHRLEDFFPPHRHADSAAERRLLRADGTEGWALWQASPLAGSPNTVVHVVDISARKRAEAQLSWQARHDPLTGLPNRRQFVDRVEAALERRRARAAGEGQVAVLFVDIDDFKLVNDSLGHGAGDRLLEGVAARLRTALRPQDVIARFGGDEFTVLLPGVEGRDDAMAVAERLAGALQAPVVLDGVPRFVSASVGLAMAQDDDACASDLLQDADSAMYRAKELGKARCAVFDDSLRARAVERLELEGALREALERDELFLEFQPQVALRDGAVVGVEALARWRHPVAGIVPPLKFIPMAERMGLIGAIGAWVLREACEHARAWDLELAVNVSPAQLGESGFPDVVGTVLAETGMPPERLCLEITESALLADVDGAPATLRALKALGVRLAIDDFGVGHASLRHLRELLPVDTLKIDKSFVDRMVEDAEDAAIVESVVRLAARLGLTCVAEGVESAAQADALAAMDCRVAQGYFYARPVAADAVAALLPA